MAINWVDFIYFVSIVRNRINKDNYHDFKKILFFLCLVLCSVGGQAKDFVIPRLSPLPVKVEKQKVPLAGNWQFSPSPGKEFWKKGSVGNWTNIKVPGEWVMQGFEVEKGKAAGYFRTFTVLSSWKGQRVKLRCNGIYSDSRIYINGKEAGSHLGGFTAFELDVTDLVQTGKENRIAVSVISERAEYSSGSVTSDRSNGESSRFFRYCKNRRNGIPSILIYTPLLVS